MMDSSCVQDDCHDHSRRVIIIRRFPLRYCAWWLRVLLVGEVGRPNGRSRSVSAPLPLHLNETTDLITTIHVINLKSCELIYYNTATLEIWPSLLPQVAIMSRPGPSTRRSAKTEYIETVGNLAYDQHGSSKTSHPPLIYDGSV
jgi:hypothetical protein